MQMQMQRGQLRITPFASRRLCRCRVRLGRRGLVVSKGAAIARQVGVINCAHRVISVIVFGSLRLGMNQPPFSPSLVRVSHRPSHKATTTWHIEGQPANAVCSTFSQPASCPSRRPRRLRFRPVLRPEQPFGNALLEALQSLGWFPRNRVVLYPVW